MNCFKPSPSTGSTGLCSMKDDERSPSMSSMCPYSTTFFSKRVAIARFCCSAVEGFAEFQVEGGGAVDGMNAGEPGCHALRPCRYGSVECAPLQNRDSECLKEICTDTVGLLRTIGFALRSQPSNNLDRLVELRALPVFSLRLNRYCVGWMLSRQQPSKQNNREGGPNELSRNKPRYVQGSYSSKGVTQRTCDGDGRICK